MHVLYVKGLSPTCEQYERLSFFCVLVLAASGSFSCIEPANKLELRNALQDGGYDIVYYRGHGNQDGNWILSNNDVITKEAVEEAIGQKNLVVIYSTACFSHKWTKQLDMLRFVGSSSSYKPFERGSGLFNYFLSHGLDAAVYYLYGNALQGRNFFSKEHYRATAFDLVETFYNNNMSALDINLLKLVPDHYVELRLAFFNSRTSVQHLPKSDCGQHFPRGFIDWQYFVTCMGKLKTNRLGSEFVIHGSSVSGYRFKMKPGKGFWFDESSDYDIAVCNLKLFKIIIDTNSSMEKDGNHTEEITRERNCWFPKVHDSAQTIFPRTVNFIVYKELSDALQHPGLSLVVNVDENGLTSTYYTGEQLDFLKWTLE